jgi:hypothetical protein
MGTCEGTMTYDITEGYYHDPAISYVRAGERSDFRGGPAKLDGWYIDPFCQVGCCRPWGPFTSEEAAREWSARVLATDDGWESDEGKYGPTPRG